MRDAAGAAACSKSSSSTRVALREKTLKFTPPGCTVAPRGAGRPGPIPAALACAPDVLIARRIPPPSEPSRVRADDPQRPQLVRHVQGGDLVRLGQGRVVEDAVDEVVDAGSAAHQRLADVNR